MKKTVFFFALAILGLGLSAQEMPKPLVITPQTHFVQLPSDCDWVSDLVDGVWLVERNNTYGFYTDEGRRLFNFEWEVGGGYRTPQMNGGAILMYKKGDVNLRKPMYILYRDGHAKELPADYIGPATNFVDGVALIGKKRASGYGVDYVYINMNGERVYGNLVSRPERFDHINNTLPPLKEGLRAYRSLNSSGYGDKWGYIDSKGAVVIPAKYDECRSFSEGYALVREGRDFYFIDKKGNKVIEPIWEDDTYFSYISDVHDGYFAVNYSPRVYYNTQGKKVNKLPRGSSFYQGYCFAEDATAFNEKSRVFDKDFKVVRTIPEVDLWWNDDGHAPVFTPAGVATVKQERVLAPDGTTLIMHYPTSKKSPNRNWIGFFSASGYAQASLRHNNVDYEGFINLNGEFEIIYRWNPDVSPIVCDPNNPRYTCDTCPDAAANDPCVIVVPEPEPPIGDLPPVRVDYNVTVIAAPSEGGTVKGGGKYHLGDKVTLSATPNKDWVLYKWESQTPGYYNSKLPDGVVMNGQDLVFVATFLPEVKKEDPTPPEETASYGGHQTMLYNKTVNVEYDVYMEMSADKNIESPYGKETYGFLTCVFDPNKVITEEFSVNGQASTATSKMFFVPMKISGIIKESDGKQYLVLDGGQFMVSEMQVSTPDPMVTFFTNMILGGEGTLYTVSDGRYRLELTDYNKETGECTFGELYRFHPDFGWMLPLTRA